MIFDKNVDLGAIQLTQDPVFIVGCPRSGTTLLQALLATQAGFYSFIETHFFNLIINDVELDNNNIVQIDCLNRVLVSLKKYMALNFPPLVKRQLKSLTEKGQLDIKKLFEIVVYPFLKEQVDEDNYNCCRWIEKTPSHFHSLERIAMLYPHAQFLCIIRHPIPVILSRKNYIQVDRKIPVQALAQQWNTMIKKVEDFKKQYSNKLMIVRYEDLVADLMQTMSSVMKYLKMPFDREKLCQFGKISTEFILPWEKWKKGVTTGKLKNTNSTWLNNAGFFNTLIIQAITRPFMEKYKYEVNNSNLHRISNCFVRPSMKKYY